MLRLKENEVYFVAASRETSGFDFEGLCFEDMLYIARYEWDFGPTVRLHREIESNRLAEYHSLPARDRSEAIAIHRDFSLTESGTRDRLRIVNPTTATRRIFIRLNLVPAFEDLMASWVQHENSNEIKRSQHVSGAVRFERRGSDERLRAIEIQTAPTSSDCKWQLMLDPKSETQVSVSCDVVGKRPSNVAEMPPLPSYEAWRQRFQGLVDGSSRPSVVNQSVDDLRALLLRTSHGPYPAAGIPFFVHFFGRDALITAIMLKDYVPELLNTVLKFLAEFQGTKTVAFSEEEPGKILHEMRRGELCASGQLPFGRYYGTADATPLFVIAAHLVWQRASHGDVIEALRPNVERALGWILAHTDRPPHLATFESSGSGLAIQSWKDSPTSMRDEEGQLVAQPLAVSEVQGYCYAALKAGAEMFSDTPSLSQRLADRAETLFKTFNERFWLSRLGTYALALDGNGRPLKVRSSDPGHLLWSGIVPEDRAKPLVHTMMSNDVYSGWGVRTLAKSAAAYHPVTYHNGSVWPHDTGLFAMGLARYGFTDALKRIAGDLIELAARSPNQHMPEVIAGYDRNDFASPVAYIHSNAPQAWSAATTILMAHYLNSTSEPGS